ncbi:hypothetical protein SNEBB_003200 [Seison nebaliae]|nr:hypothetical protein SNEBB_003200 [Seison nebaliae]
MMMSKYHKIFSNSSRYLSNHLLTPSSHQQQQQQQQQLILSAKYKILLPQLLFINQRQLITTSFLNNINNNNNNNNNSDDVDNNKINGYSLDNVRQLTIEEQSGTPILVVPLPSRREYCRFVLRPISDTVQTLCTNIRNEDAGIDYIAIYNDKNIRLAGSTSVDTLLLNDFRLIINRDAFDVTVPPQIKLFDSQETNSSINQFAVDDVRSLVNKLYVGLSVSEHQIKKEKELMKKLEELKSEVAPMDSACKELHRKSRKFTNRIVWLFMGVMAFQTGLLARLTWWEYSWDIVEPVTYFVTYGGLMSAYAYYLLTKSDYVYDSAGDRIYLGHFHRLISKTTLDIKKYNELKDEIFQLENDLCRLRDPLIFQLPVPPPLGIQPLKPKSKPDSLISALPKTVDKQL